VALKATSIILDPLTDDPVSPVEGELWYNVTDKKLRVRLDGVTQDVGDLFGPNGTVYGALPKFDGDTGKKIKGTATVVADTGGINGSDDGLFQFQYVKVSNVTTFVQEYDHGTVSSTPYEINTDLGQKHLITLGGNLTFTFATFQGPANFVLRLVQDGTGGRTVTWPANVKWPGGTAPTLSTAAGAEDIISLYYNGTNYYGVASLNFS
jgi:hypothetical protein